MGYSYATVRNLQTKMIIDKRIKEIAKLNFVKGEPFLNQVSAAWEVEYRQRWVRFILIAQPPPSCLIPLRLPPHLGVSTRGGCLFNRFVYGLHILEGFCMHSVSSVLYVACANYPI